MQIRPIEEKEEECFPALFSLDKWIQRLRGGGLDIEVAEKDKELIEYRLMDEDLRKTVSRMIKECAERFEFKKFLLILNKKEKRICYFDANKDVDRIVINFSYFSGNEKSQESLHLAGKMARAFSGTAV